MSSSSVGVEMQKKLVDIALQIEGAPVGAQSIVTPDFASFIMDLATSLMTSCLGNSNNTAATAATFRQYSTEPAYNSILKVRAVRAALRNGLSREQGLLGHKTLSAMPEHCTDGKMAMAIAHEQGFSDSFPEMDMF